MPKCANMVRVYHDFISDVGGGGFKSYPVAILFDGGVVVDI